MSKKNGEGMFFEIAEVKYDAPKTNEGALEAHLLSLVEKYKGLKATKKNEGELKAAKADLTSVRVRIKNGVKDWKDMVLKPISANLDASAKKLLEITEDLEAQVDKGLAKIDQTRINDMTKAYDKAKKALFTEFSLDVELMDSIEYPKNFYNKDGKTLELSLARLRDMVEELSKEIKKRKSEEALITKACKVQGLTASVFIDKLDYKDVATILEEIEDVANEREEEESLDIHTYEEVEATNLRGENVKVSALKEEEKTVLVSFTYTESSKENLKKALKDTGFEFEIVG